MPNPTRTQAIKNYLMATARLDLASLYNADMEVQVNVAQDNGDLVKGDYQGRAWRAWTDGIQTWKSFRVPFKANTVPEYSDVEIKFDIAAHAEGIGMTGWDWKKRVSRWVAFDFDAIAGHKKGLSNQELTEITENVSNIPWVTVRRSTSGKGIHLYIFLPEIRTANHNEHAALARAILGKMAAITGYDFQSKVDICGHVMWCWHRRMHPENGLVLLKKGGVMPLDAIPQNWKDHIPVVSNKRRKSLPQFIDEKKDLEDIFDELCGQYPTTPLDDGHKELIEHFRKTNALWWWDQDHHMLITHTIHLQEAYDALNIKGIFKTAAEGKERGIDHNCFCFPLRNGAWAIRRYTPGVQEDDSWEQDRAGWTRCFFNREVDLATASRTHEGIEHPGGGFVFRHAELATKAAEFLGVHLDYATWAGGRKAKLKTHRDGRLIVEVDAENTDNASEMGGWLVEKGRYQKIYNTKVSEPTEPEVANYDDLTRHIVTEGGDDYGWVIRSDNEWRSEPLIHIRTALEALGHSPKDVKTILGASVFKAWKLVNKPFQPEYPGDREWNRNSAQMRFIPPTGKDLLLAPTWSKVLRHCGSGLDDAVKYNGWCKANGISDGGEYIKCWIASLFQSPDQPLPYLFMYGPQNSGKSILHEAIELLLTSGYVRSDHALISQSGFNGELEGAIICVVEEINLNKNLSAYNRIKDWVTSRYLPIHRKQKTPYLVPNTTHWVQCANEHTACPIFPGDARITMTYVDTLDPLELIPKRQLIQMLESEAPDFMGQVLSLEIPPSNDRLNVPVIETEDKKLTASANQTMLELFIEEQCHYRPGTLTKYSDFFEHFKNWLDPLYVADWSKIRVGRELPPQFAKGRSAKAANQVFIGNITFDEDIPAEDFRFIVRDEQLIEVPLKHEQL